MAPDAAGRWGGWRDGGRRGGGMGGHLGRVRTTTWVEGGINDGLGAGKWEEYVICYFSY